MIVKKERLIPQPTLSEAHIVRTFHQAACPCSKDTCMVFRIIWHLRCLSPTLVSVSPMNFPPRRNSRVIYIKRKSIAGSGKGEQCFGVFCRHGGDLCRGIRRGGRRR